MKSIITFLLLTTVSTSYGQFTTTNIPLQDDNDGSHTTATYTKYIQTYTVPNEGYFYTINFRLYSGLAQTVDFTINIYRDGNPADGLPTPVVSRNMSTSFGTAATIKDESRTLSPSLISSGRVEKFEFGEVISIEVEITNASAGGIVSILGNNDATGQYTDGQVYVATGAGAYAAHPSSGWDFEGIGVQGIAHTSFSTWSSTSAGNFTNGGNWNRGGESPWNSANIEMSNVMTYDETNDYTSTPIIYDDLTLSGSGSLVTNANSDFCFQGSLSGGNTTITGNSTGEIVWYKPFNYRQLNNVHINGPSRFFGPSSSGSPDVVYVNNLNLEDGGIVYLEGLKIEIDGLTIKQGGALMIDQVDGEINVGRNPASGNLEIQNGGTLGSNTDNSATIDLKNSGDQVVFKSGANYLPFSGNPWTWQGAAKPEFQYEIADIANAHWHQFHVPGFAGLSWAPGNELYDGLNINQTNVSTTHNLWYWSNTENGTTGEYNGWQMENSTGAKSGTNYTIYLGPPYFPQGNNILSFKDDVTGFPSVSSGGYNAGIGDVDLYIPGTSSGGLDQDKGWIEARNSYLAHVDIDEWLNSTDFNLAYHGVHYWDAATDQYIAYIDGPTGSITSATDGGTAAAGNYERFLPPSRAFWLKLSGSETSSDAVLKPIYRATPSDLSGLSGTLNSGFKTTSGPEILKISVTNPKGYEYPIIWNNVMNASHGFGIGDAFAIDPSVSQAPFVYDYTPEPSKLVINSLDFLNFTKRTIGFKVEGNDIYTWSLDSNAIAGLNNVYLKDLKTGSIKDLSVGSYSFTNDPTFTSERFELTINGTISIEENFESELKAYYSNNTLYMDAGDFTINNFSITDMSGRLMFQGSESMNSHQELDVSNLSNGVYVLKIQNNEGKYQIVKFVKS